jgi:hypothetical protein
MALTSLMYDPPIRREARPAKRDYDLLEAAVTLSEEGKALESASTVFRHLFPTQEIPDLATTPFSFIQGSSRVTARIDGEEIVITVPLVRLPTGGSAIAALRYVLTKIAGSGQLHQPRLRGDDIYLEFRDKLSRLHPAKLVEVLRRMPVEADDNDDWLVGQFSAQPLERAPITDVDDAELDKCDAIWRGHWNDVEELLKESHKKRSVWFLNEVTAYAVFRIRFAIPLIGFLASRLAESAGTFNDGQEDPDKREATLAKCIKEMKAVTKEELRKNLGHVVYAFSPLAEGTSSTLSDYFEGNYIEKIDELRKTGKTFDAALGMICTYNFLLARYFWPEEVENELKAGLAQASGKPWREAANLLADHARELIAKFGTDEGGEDDDEEASATSGGDGDEAAQAEEES